jgi:threonine/homoserine/homoserine lactone efflux protein
MFWIGLGDRIAARFRDEAHARLLNRVFGSVLIRVAVWMVLR